MRLRRRWWISLVGIGAGSLLVLLLVPGIFTPLLERLLIVDVPLEKADALVLMAGGSRERLPSVLRLYRRGIAPRILLTNDGILGGWSREHGRNLYQVEWAELELLRQNVPAEAVSKLDYTVSGTIHDAWHAVSFARENGLCRLLVVTSDFHTRRTLWSFRKIVGDNPIEVGVHPATSRTRSAHDDQQLRILTVEMLKFLVYRLVYGGGGVSEGL